MVPMLQHGNPRKTLQRREAPQYRTRFLPLDAGASKPAFPSQSLGTINSAINPGGSVANLPPITPPQANSFLLGFLERIFGTNMITTTERGFDVYWASSNMKEILRKSIKNALNHHKYR